MSVVFRGQVPMMVSKAPCTVTGCGEDTRQEPAPKSRHFDKAKGTWKAVNVERAHFRKRLKGKSLI
ncbi:hypothetical protein A6J73_01800 [Enterococcus hirae]|nr:hypothetical protein A6J73_01800 [Enterococcus hirae]OZS40614.1 hypothetical protein CHB54_12400 [Enterococcus hirae]PWG77121.1 hypothetical protein DF186_02565 [Enterococcus hirae]